MWKSSKIVHPVLQLCGTMFSPVDAETWKNGIWFSCGNLNDRFRALGSASTSMVSLCLKIMRLIVEARLRVHTAPRESLIADLVGNADHRDIFIAVPLHLREPLLQVLVREQVL